MAKPKVEPFLSQWFRLPFENPMKVREPPSAYDHACNIAHVIWGVHKLPRAHRSDEKELD